MSLPYSDLSLLESLGGGRCSADFPAPFNLMSVDSARASGRALSLPPPWEGQRSLLNWGL